MIDRASFAAAWSALGAQGDCAALHRKLVGCWSEKQRHYHTLQHLRECFEKFDEARLDAKDPCMIAIALWFHDSIYDPTRSDNEERSADWARNEAVKAGMSMETAQRLHDLVMATKHETMPDDADARLLVDLDLSILGSSIERFEESDEQIRREYAHVPESDWKAGRKRVLRGFLDRQRLYGTDRYHTALEARARENLERALKKLDA